ncbi:endosialin-like [Lampris incognitus]|uniref:endosialin-like n=1 Tax=Lampris incognitus TaxID=2546036 RepID=UPI0024B56508|nr:endosialin-like [Lampris incognitus]
MRRWRMRGLRSSSSSSSSTMSLLCALWLLTICLAPGSQGQRLGETEGEQPAARAETTERDALCHQEGCYAVFLQRRTFREAGRSCRERGGTLATMHDDQAAGVVHELLSSVEPQGSRVRLRLWIGLHRPPRQCSSTRPLRGFVWVTGDLDGQYTNWLRDDVPGSCAAPRCVAMTVHASESARKSNDNFRWLDGSCGLGLDGYVCQYNYRAMCPPLEDEGGGLAIYTTPFHLVTTLLTHVPFGSIATLPCPGDDSEPDGPAEQSVLCIEREDGTVGWSRDAPFCSSDTTPHTQDWCSTDHGCEQHCQNTDSDYYCYCSEGFTLEEDGYSCKPDPLSQTDSPYSSTPTEEPQISQACVAAGCEYNCMETPRGVRCTCPPGYQVGPDGRGCSDVDECRQQPCPQLCVNTPGTFHCACDPGYQPDNDGECVDVDECLDEGSCEGSCENTVGSFTCLCHPGNERGSGGECVDIDECVGESPCQQQCLNYVGGYQCYCDYGYHLQSDGLSCQPSPEDEEYSTLTPDPTDIVNDPDFDSNPNDNPYSHPNSDSNSNHDIPWSTSFTPDPNFEPDPDFDTDWLTEPPGKLTPDIAPPPWSDDHLNQWDALSPRQHHTDPPPIQHDSTGNQLDNEAEAKTGTREVGGGAGSKAVTRADIDTANGSGSNTNIAVKAGAETGTESVSGEAETDGETGTGYIGGTEEEGAESTAGKRKHDKSWLLVALLVPLCVFLVVMLALGIVYCTSCAVDKSQSFSDCYRWILPTTPPEGRDTKPQA